MQEAANPGAQAPADADLVRANLVQQHVLIRQADEYADLFTQAAMAASAAVTRAMDVRPGAQE